MVAVRVKRRLSQRRVADVVRPADSVRKQRETSFPYLRKRRVARTLVFVVSRQPRQLWLRAAAVPRHLCPRVAVVPRRPCLHAARADQHHAIVVLRSRRRAVTVIAVSLLENSSGACLAVSPKRVAESALAAELGEGQAAAIYWVAAPVEAAGFRMAAAAAMVAVESRLAVTAAAIAVAMLVVAAEVAVAAAVRATEKSTDRLTTFCGGRAE